MAPTGKPEINPRIKAVEQYPLTLKTGFIILLNILSKISAIPKDIDSEEKTKNGNNVGTITFIHRFKASLEALKDSAGETRSPMSPETEIKIKIYFLKKFTP